MRPGPSDRVVRRGRWLSVVSVVCILGWAVPALLMLDRGFAVQDEGTYVLSYRYWDSNPYFVTGSQYFFGPIFETIGESIPLLRVLRLVMVIGANAWFGWAFLRWLDLRREGPLPSSRLSLTLLVTAGGGMSYLWTPLTPGYYDLTADLSLSLVALLLLTLTRAPRIPLWNPLLTGVLAVALLVDKWTACLVVVLICSTALWSLLRTDLRAAARYAALVAAGSVVALAGCQLLLIDLGRFLRVMWKVSGLTTVGSHSFTYLAKSNFSSTLILFIGGLILGVVLLVTLFVAVVLSRAGRLQAARVWLLVGAVLSIAVVPFAAGWRGGDGHGRVVVEVALGGLIAALIAALLSRSRVVPQTSEGRFVAVVLLLIPLLQAAGTNVVLPYIAVECIATWIALILMLAADGDGFPVGSTAVLVELAVLIVATAMICGTTTLMTPFKTSSYADSDSPRVPGLGVRLSQKTADQYSALDKALNPYLTPGRTPMITLDQKAGLTYLLDALPAGSTWTDVASPTRTAGILELACDNGDVPDATPVLLLDRKVDRYLAQAMQRCGFDYPADFRRLPVPGGPPDLTVYVPRRSD